MPSWQDLDIGEPLDNSLASGVAPTGPCRVLDLPGLTPLAARSVELFVRDTGPGLSPELQQRIFEPFYSTKSHGLGMGLAIVRSIVERHGGQVRAENHDGRGAVFRVQLPVRR